MYELDGWTDGWPVPRPSPGLRDLEERVRRGQHAAHQFRVLSSSKPSECFSFTPQTTANEKLTRSSSEGRKSVHPQLSLSLSLSPSLSPPFLSSPLDVDSVICLHLSFTLYFTIRLLGLSLTHSLTLLLTFLGEVRNGSNRCRNGRKARVRVCTAHDCKALSAPALSAAAAAPPPAAAVAGILAQIVAK